VQTADHRGRDPQADQGAEADHNGGHEATASFLDHCLFSFNCLFIFLVSGNGGDKSFDQCAKATAGQAANQTRDSPDADNSSHGHDHTYGKTRGLLSYISTGLSFFNYLCCHGALLCSVEEELCNRLPSLKQQPCQNKNRAKKIVGKINKILIFNVFTEYFTPVPRRLETTHLQHISGRTTGMPRF
jgi:hypothetical protein